ncbi:MAG: hypothetical protein GX305_08945 [Aminobacterium colombiense]|jgi:ABC-type dipeptide/oligopeptide/nickel transport system permease component|nr:hypothetical protein [Aminobacterium colombiense]
MVRIASFIRTYLLRMVIVALGVSTLCFLAVEFSPGDRAFDVAIARYGLDAQLSRRQNMFETVRVSTGILLSVIRPGSLP